MEITPVSETEPTIVGSSAKTSQVGCVKSTVDSRIERKARIAEKRAAKAARKAAKKDKANGQTLDVLDSITDSGSNAFAFGMTEKRLRMTFAKELKKRDTGGMKKGLTASTRGAGDHEVTEASMRCDHNWSSSGAGGVRCQICNFETKDNSYNCRHPGCEIKLCGSCHWKWTHK